jgi:acetyltransferase
VVAIRPAARGDRDRIQALVRGLKPRSRQLRFFHGVQELSQPLLERFSRAEARGDYTLLAFAVDRIGEIPVGMAQYSAAPYPTRCEFAVVVADAWQGLGIGARLVRGMVSTARAAGFESIDGEVLIENKPMLSLIRNAGFRLRRDFESALLIRASLPLAAPLIYKEQIDVRQAVEVVA